MSKTSPKYGNTPTELLKKHRDKLQGMIEELEQEIKEAEPQFEEGQYYTLEFKSDMKNPTAKFKDKHPIWYDGSTGLMPVKDEVWHLATDEEILQFLIKQAKFNGTYVEPGKKVVAKSDQTKKTSIVIVGQYYLTSFKKLHFTDPEGFTYNFDAFQPYQPEPPKIKMAWFKVEVQKGGVKIRHEINANNYTEGWLRSEDIHKLSQYYKELELDKESK